MELELFIEGRSVKYCFGKESGEGLENLIKIANQDFKKIVVKGETKSYSFLRQICLFVNLLVASRGIVADLKSKSFTIKDGNLLPVYE